MNETPPVTGCLTFYGAIVGMVLILLILLKLFGFVSISWIWVLSPIWITWILSLVCVAICYPLYSK